MYLFSNSRHNVCILHISEDATNKNAIINIPQGLAIVANVTQALSDSSSILQKLKRVLLDSILKSKVIQRYF